MKRQTVKMSLVMVILVCTMFSGCTNKPGYSLEINPAVKQSDFKVFGMVLFSMAKSHIAVDIKNAGAYELNFVKCDYNILGTDDGKVKYTGTIDLIDKLAPGEKVSRDSSEINENLANDNDGRNFVLDLSCYSQELKAAGLVFPKRIQFT
jgi:hypothetical protein